MSHAILQVFSDREVCCRSTCLLQCNPSNSPLSPAEIAGLEGGDIIVSLAGKTIPSIHDYADAIDELAIDKPVSMSPVAGVHSDAGQPPQTFSAEAVSRAVYRANLEPGDDATIPSAAGT